MRIEDLGLVAKVLLRFQCTTHADDPPAFEKSIKAVYVSKRTY